MSTSPNRVTLRDIARRLRLSHSTVSLALKNNVKIAEKTRYRVKAEAERCGYRPEPMLSALAAYRQMKKPPIYHGMIAWLSSHSSSTEDFYRTPYPENSLYRQYYDGACRRANSLGYRVKEYSLNRDDMTPERMSNILIAQGVQGIIVPPLSSLGQHINMRWELFSAVRFGFSLERPQLSVISSAQYRNSLIVVKKLQTLGYQRIGFFGSHEFDDRTDGNFTAGYRSALKKMPHSCHIPLLLTEEGARLENTITRIREWVTDWKIDAVVCVTGMQDELIQAGYRIPEDFAIALLTHNKGIQGFAGIDEQGYRTGAAAVDCTINMIHCGERGVPDVPFQMLIEGTWTDGPTAPPVAH
jgi:LacI family transcriptional regulator